MLGQNQALVGKSAMECQIERHLWYQLCFLDIRTAEAQGPIPTLASEDYGVQLPLNTDDVDIFKGSKATSHFIFTESTFSLIRYECYEVHRLIFRGREAMEKKKTSLQDLIDTIDCRKSHIETNYLQYLDCQIPVQKCAKVVGALLIARFDAMLLHENIPRDRLSREPYHLPLAHR